jgi:uncharacterized protein YjiS (DUF1127 family)
MILNHVIHALRVWRLYRASVRELSRLTDLELSDIGLVRSGIESVAWHSARNYLANKKPASGSRVDSTKRQ